MGLLVMVLLIGACRPTLRPEESAAVYVVQDMLERIQPEGVEITRRYIASMWQGPAPVDSVYPAAVEASGLSALLLSDAASADSATLVLNLFRPTALGGDSMRVVAEWLIFEPGEVFWGTQYEYTLKCTSSCELLARHGPGYLN